MNLNEELLNFITISRFAGERFDLIQAGGGNSSVKIGEDRMLIKSSGNLLSEVNENNGYVKVSLKKVLAIFEDYQINVSDNKRVRENRATQLIKESITESESTNRPSIETFLHALLFKYTLHTHPIAVNMLTCKVNWKELLTKLFPEALLVDYRTPGIELAQELKKQCEKYHKQWGHLPQIIFLQNHGLIVSTENASEIVTITNQTVQIIEEALDINLNKYKLTNQLTAIMKEYDNNDVLSYLSEDLYLTNRLRNNKLKEHSIPLCPDTLVFCGFHTIDIKDQSKSYKLRKYIDNYQSFPKVVIYKGCLFFISQTIKKAKEAEEVFKADQMIREQVDNEHNSLLSQELQYLDNWKAEKFRQTI